MKDPNVLGLITVGSTANQTIVFNGYYMHRCKVSHCSQISVRYATLTHSSHHVFQKLPIVATAVYHKLTLATVDTNLTGLSWLQTLS